jgi:putative membrane protein
MSFGRRIMISWVCDSIALGAAAWFLSGVYGSVIAVIGAALVFGLLSAVLKPVLRFLTLPFAVITLGIAWFFVAMFILWLTSRIVSGFHINGFWTLAGATVVVWLVGSVSGRFLFPPKKKRGKN